MKLKFHAGGIKAKTKVAMFYNIAFFVHPPY